MSEAKKNPTTFRVLIVDDDDGVRAVLQSRLERRGHKVAAAKDGDEAVEIARAFDPSVVVTDLRMPGRDGFSVLKAIKVPSILITGHGDKESAIQAVEAGAFAFFEKPFDLDALEVSVVRAAERRLMELEKEQLLKRLDRLVRLQGREIENLEAKESASFVGRAPALVEIRAMLQRLALKPQATLLILGETGTGKEVVARELHQLTHPAKSSSHVPFIPVNCAAIPAELLESEIYGHEKGSFSGAHTQRVGLAEAVREGTLFLDELGELDPRHQAKLLRLLQERSFRRVGSNREIPFQGRIVAATHRDLKSRFKTGEFREDLYYRLSVVSVTLPPLRERGEDILEVAESLCRRHGLAGLAPAARGAALSYEWPGNIRELGNWIERAAILGQHDDEGLVTGLPPASEGTGVAAAASSPNAAALADEESAEGVTDLKAWRAAALDRIDRELIQKALAENGGNVSAAARTLGMDRKNLSKRIKALGLKAAA
jgi:DNA-binding NtrC family response regulator